MAGIPLPARGTVESEIDCCPVCGLVCVCGTLAPEVDPHTWEVIHTIQVGKVLRGTRIPEAMSEWWQKPGTRRWCRVLKGRGGKKV